MRAQRRFGQFGGRYVAPPLLPTLDALADAFDHAWADSSFQQEYSKLLKSFAARPTRLSFAEKLSKWNGGAAIYLKREDQTSAGGSYINAALGQSLLAKRMGKSAVVGDTGSGENGVAAAAVAALLDLDCTIYMAERDMAAQPLTVSKAQQFGAKLVPVKTEDATLHAAMSAATQHWMSASHDTAYVAGAPVGPYPYPHMVRSFQSVIGTEARAQAAKEIEQDIAAVVATVGGGASASGIFSAFLSDEAVDLIAAEPKHAARLLEGTPGILHGAETLVLQTRDGQIARLDSNTPGISYPAVGPEIAYWLKTQRVQPRAVEPSDAAMALRALAEREGILVSNEAAYAVAAALDEAKRLISDEAILVSITSGGDKDLKFGGVPTP